MNKEKIEKDFETYQLKKKENLEQNKEIKGKHIRIIIRPLLRLALFIQRKLKKQNVQIIGNKNYVLPKDRPVIFSVSHIGKYDFEIVNELISEQFYILLSDYRNMHGNFNGFMVNLFGCVFVNEISKEDRINSSLTMKKILNTKAFGKPLNAMIFGEGTWNLSENEIIYDISFGTVDIAMSTNGVILPIGIEQYENNFIVNFGEIYDPNLIAKTITNIPYNQLNLNNPKEKSLQYIIKEFTNNELRDRLATLKYEIWEKNGIVKRESIQVDYWKRYIEERLKEWPGYSMQEQIDSVYHPKYKIEYEQVKDDLKKVKPNENNQFMFIDDSKIKRYVNAYNRKEEIRESLETERKNNKPKILQKII